MHHLEIKVLNIIDARCNHEVKIYIKMSYIRFYMFRSTWTILRVLTLSLAKVTLFVELISKNTSL